MKQVIVHPERCLGCMQCVPACAAAHSASGTYFGALLEHPRPRARIHLGVGPADRGFPNRCRHCDPAPCLAACLPGAIFRDPRRGTVLINPDICINCASCAMACPFGVLRFHEDRVAPPKKVVAIKCDNCDQRQEKGLIPACVEVCKAGALTFEEPDAAAKRKTNQVSAAMLSRGETAPSPGFALLNAMKKSMSAINRP